MNKVPVLQTPLQAQALSPTTVQTILTTQQAILADTFQELAGITTAIRAGTEHPPPHRHTPMMADTVPVSQFIITMEAALNFIHTVMI